MLTITNDYIVNIITTIRESSALNNQMYRQGDCYKFHLILKSILGDECKPKLTIEKKHILSQYKDRLYDITGEVMLFDSMYLDIKLDEYEDIEKWGFWKSNAILNECPKCGEELHD